MINYDFIGRQFEGVKLVGYVPPLDGGKIESGVSIADGFDIGQRSTDEIADAFDLALSLKLAPYCEVTGEEAVKLLSRMPLTITEKECSTISEYSHKQATEALLHDWYKYSKVSFATLTNEAQTVIASVAFQYGDLPSRCPNFWKQAITQDWEGMLKNLWNFGDAYETRRRQEYILLLWGMTK